MPPHKALCRNDELNISPYTELEPLLSLLSTQIYTHIVDDEVEAAMKGFREPESGRESEPKEADG